MSKTFDLAKLPSSVSVDASNNLVISNQLETSIIDTSDSSALTITPSATFSSDVSVENNFTVQTDALFVETGGRIGVGTTSPTYNMHINDTVAGGNKFGITAPGGTEPNFIMQGDGEQTFRFYNTAASGSTRVSWKLANRNHTDWEYIMYTDIDQDGTESFRLQGKTAGNTLTLRDGGLSTTGTFTASGAITGPTTDTLLIKNSAGSTLKTIRGV